MYTFSKNTIKGQPMQQQQATEQKRKSKKGGARKGAGRPALRPPSTPIRVDNRLIPFVEWVRCNGISDDILVTINGLIEPEAKAETEAEIDLRATLTDLYLIPAKNRTRDVQGKIKAACKELGFNSANLTSKEKKAIIDWHTAKTATKH